jgi:hypothetical protein
MNVIRLGCSLLFVTTEIAYRRVPPRKTQSEVANLLIREHFLEPPDMVAELTWMEHPHSMACVVLAVPVWIKQHRRHCDSSLYARFDQVDTKPVCIPYGLLDRAFVWWLTVQCDLFTVEGDPPISGLCVVLGLYSEQAMLGDDDVINIEVRTLEVMKDSEAIQHQLIKDLPNFSLSLDSSLIPRNLSFVASNSDDEVDSHDDRKSEQNVWSPRDLPRIANNLIHGGSSYRARNKRQFPDLDSDCRNLLLQGLPSAPQHYALQWDGLPIICPHSGIPFMPGCGYSRGSHCEEQVNVILGCAPRMDRGWHYDAPWGLATGAPWHSLPSETGTGGRVVDAVSAGPGDRSMNRAHG